MTAPSASVLLDTSARGDSPPSAFAEYATALSALNADADPLLALLPGSGWRRRYARFDPWRAPYCTFAYDRQGGAEAVLLRIFQQREQSDRCTQHAAESAVGVIAIDSVAHDPALPTLAQVMAQRPDARIVRYRPYRRCTLIVGDGEATSFGKVFADQQAKPIFETSQQLWQLREQLGFRVAAPRACDQDARCVWLARVPGEPVVDRLRGPGGPALAMRMGNACAQLTLASLKPRVTFDCGDQMARSERYATEIALRIPALSTDLARLLVKIGVLHQAAGEVPLRPIHSAPHAHQWLDDGERLGLVDFDRFCLGHPELDVATFIAEMDFERRAPVAQINAAFIDGYEQVGARLNPHLLTAYRAHKQLAKVLKAARAPNLSAPEKAARHLRRALALGEGECA